MCRFESGRPHVMAQILTSTERHYHVMAGVPGVLPFCDVAYDNSMEAVNTFLKISDSLGAGRIKPETRFAAEAQLYTVFDEQDDYGVYVECPPFRVMIMDCDECKSALLN